jgi:hypothetical protein
MRGPMSDDVDLRHHKNQYHRKNLHYRRDD